MAPAAKKAVPAVIRPKQEEIVNFEPERLRAPFALRCASFAIDYLVFIVAPVLWLLISGPITGSGSTASIAPIAWIIGLLLAMANIVLLPMWRGQSLGKLLTGLTIVGLNGSSISPVTLLKRNLIGYFVTMLTLGIGFFVAALNKRGRSLHDVIGGTMVIRGRRKQV